MALSMDSLYKPLNQFFLDKFGPGARAGAGAPVKFCFAHTPLSISDSDLLVPDHPEWGPSEALAKEVFSGLIDAVPRADADGQSVWMGPNNISELYADEMLGPAMPFVASTGLDAATQQSLTDAVNQVKADALEALKNVRSMSLLQNGLEFHPSSPTPRRWWNKTDPDAWAPQIFHIADAAAPATAASNQLLRMQIDDDRMRTVVTPNLPPAPVIRPAATAVHLAVPAAAAHPAAPAAVHLVPPAAAVVHPAVPAAAHPAVPAAVHLAAPVAPMVAARMMPAAAGPLGHAQERSEIPPVAPRPGIPPPPAALHAAALADIRAMPVMQRTPYLAVLYTYAPKQAVTTAEATISFDYAVVSAERGWMHDAFIHNGSWAIAQLAKGQLSANDGHGVPALPVGFVAVKNLKITAPWTQDDVTNLQQSTHFGPFRFDLPVANGTIGHDGIQIVGWILQDMPPLPPNDGPGGQEPENHGAAGARALGAEGRGRRRGRGQGGKVRDAIRALPAPVAQETKDAALTWIELLDKAGGFSDKMTASADGDAIRMDVQGDRFNVFLHLAPRLAAGARRGRRRESERCNQSALGSCRAGDQGRRSDLDRTARQSGRIF